MYSYGGQLIDTPLDDNGQSYPASHSSYTGAASSDLDYEQPQHNFVNAQTSQSHDFFLTPSQSSGDQSSALFLNAPLSNPNFFSCASQSAADYQNPHFVDLRTNLRNPYDLVMAGADEDSSTSFVDNTSQFALDPYVGYHPMYNPSNIPYKDYEPPRPSSQHYPVFPPPMVSIDGMTTLAPGSEDIPALGELLGLAEPSPLGYSFHAGEAKPPPPCPSGSLGRQPPEKPLEIIFWPYPCARARPKLRGLTSVLGFSDVAQSTTPWRPSRIAPLWYDNKIQIHRDIFQDARETHIRSTLSSCPFLTEQERKTAAHESLVSAANAHDEEYGSQWGAENFATFYQSFEMLPSAHILSTCKKIARAVVQIGYDLRPPIWSDDSEPHHQIDTFIFGNDSGNHQDDEVYPFEHCVLSMVVLNTILTLGYVPYVTELDSLFCTAAGPWSVLYRSEQQYTLLSDYIKDHIRTNPQFSTRWEEYKDRIRARLVDIAAYPHV
ncbi:hypothetical protein EV702DRAFT_1195443 [Suillus placidus]|uniref:Uncharacterized protein n=1 Tax=Suillus placidus TaxID=48579 RepID=A0A9P6ZZY9_9AGAM|nr:hypothetical protein EV702DRAFT_1195443 [Suillus placidus]